MTSTAARPKHDRTFHYAAAVVATVIAYGSLFPFDFDAAHAARAWASGLLLGWVAPSRGDLVSNLILYAPLGALLMVALGAQRSAAAAAAFTLAAGMGLSLAIELVQNALPDRTPSAIDLVLNGIGTALGIGAARAWHRLGRPALAPAGLPGRWLREPRDPIALLALGVWFAAHTAPFVPHGDVHSAWVAIAPLREFALTPQGILKYFAGTLVLACVLRAAIRRDRFWAAFIGISLLALACRVLFLRQNLGPNEPLAMLLALPIVIALRRQPNEEGARTVLAWSGIAWLACGLVPFDFRSAAAQFEWRPFAGFLTGDVESGYLVFLEKAAFFTAWTWLAAYARVPRAQVLVLGIAGLGAVEVAQCWLPGRTGEITDPLLFALVAATVARIGVRSLHSGERHAARIAKRRALRGTTGGTGDEDGPGTRPDASALARELQPRSPISRST